MSKFVNLHVHTEYSLLDGACRIDKLISHAKELGQEAIAITDHGVMYGVIDFYKEATKQGVKPIIGCEVYTAARSRYDKTTEYDSEYGHLVLLAKNNTGYKNLMKIVSIGFVDGFYYKPRIDMEVLKQYSDGIIVLSACLGGDIPRLILSNNYEGAVKKALEFKEIFGRENFYIELQDHGIREQKFLNEKLIELATQTDLELVATNDVHYVNKEDAFCQDVLLCVQTAKSVDDEDRMKFETEEFYLKSYDEMHLLFEDVETALLNTAKIADMCSVELEFGKTILPKFPVPDGVSDFEFLRKLALEGLEERYGSLKQSYMEKLDYELDVINNMGFVDYFLIVWDIIRYARENNIAVGPGRGSAAGSIVSYCLKITKIDPVKYSLLFERFLNPERISMPDIDMDFCYERRQEVIDYATTKYGSDKVAQIITFGTMAARAAIRDVARALGMPYALADEIAKMIPNELKMTIDKALKVNSKLSQLCSEDDAVKKLVDTAKELEGLPRHASTHAAGVVITREPVVEYVPLQRNEEAITTQYPMTTLEELGLLKMDFLGLRTLTVIRDAIDIIKRSTAISIDIEKIDMSEPKVYRLISDGDTAGVFQLESSGMRQFMRELKPQNLEDIIAGISLYRPGPMDSIPKYIENRHDPKKVTYLHESLKDILDVTYGCIVYQEQVMQIVRKLGGFSMGRADLVRRAMSKKKEKVMEQEKQNFIYGITDEEECANIEGALEKGIPVDIATKIFDEMMDFAKYAFNKSHAAAYAVIAYQTAWLKSHYPSEFMAALMSSFLDNTSKIAEYIEDCKHLGIKLLEPNINESEPTFSATGKNIRFGLVAVKNVGRNFIADLVKERESGGRFLSFKDFCVRMSVYDINKRAVESLIKCGAFDCLGHKRSQLLAVYEKYLENASKSKKNNLSGQISLLGSTEFDITHDEDMPNIKELDNAVKLHLEKEILGIYVSGHPLDKYTDMIRRKTSTNTLEIRNIISEEESGFISDVHDGSMVIIAGIITVNKVKTTKRGEQMSFLTLEDNYGTIDILLFPRIFAQNEKLLLKGAAILVKGRLNVKEEEAVIICESIEPIISAVKKEKLYLKFELGKEDLVDKVLPVMQYYGGDVPVFLYYEKEKKTHAASSKYWVDLSDVFLDEVRRILGEDCVKIVMS